MSSVGVMAMPADFRYREVFLKGKPKHDRFDLFRARHPSMDVGRRAKIFSPFDALKGFNEAFGFRGRYRKLTGICWNVDELYGSILVDNTRISFENILRIGNADGIFQKDWTTDYPED